MVDIVWATTKENRGDNIHQVCANAVEQIMKTAIAKRTVDNITVVMIAFSSFKNFLFPKRLEMVLHNSLDNIDVGRKQFFDSSLIGNNSFDLDNRSFSLGEELGIVKTTFIEGPLNEKNALNKNLDNKKNHVLKKKPVAGIITGTTNKTSTLNGVNKGAIKQVAYKSALGAKKNEISYTSRVLTKNTQETFYKKK